MKKTLFVLILLSFLVGGTGLAGEKDFVGKDLSDGDFNGKSLNGADFTDATLRRAQFKGASLKNAKFRDAIAREAYFTDADMTGADMRGLKAGVYFERTNLGKSNWEGSELSYPSKCNFREANLKKTKITGTLYLNDFRGSDLRGANFRGATFAKDARQANLWKGAVYDDDTGFPKGFDPQTEGLILRKDDKKKDDKK